ncbi:MAG: DUF2726 domain-containing protein, partial [Opitutales bacterium]
MARLLPHSIPPAQSTDVKVEIMSKSLRLAYFLPSDVEAARNTIMGWLREHGHKQHRTLCLTQPAAVIDPSNLSGQARRACLRGVIPISIVVGKEKGTLVAAVVRPPQTRQEEGVLELLRRFRIPVFMGDLASEASLLEFLAASNPSYRFSPSFRKVTNMSEARLMRKVKSSLGILGEEEIRKLSEQWKRDLVRHYSDDSKKRFRVYEEVALPEIIDGRCDEFDDTLSAYRVDLLVASPPPQSKPLFVVEFDGPKHEDPRRREKDSVRDNVLLRHSLPVLRISYRNDLFQRDKSGVVDVVGHYFSVLINRVGEVVENEFVRKEEKAVLYDALLDGEATTEQGTNGAVRTVSTTFLLDRIAEAHGESIVEVPVGFKWVAQGMDDDGVIVGGEESGGFSVRGHLREKDGVLMALFAGAIAAAEPFDDRLDRLAE